MNEFINSQNHASEIALGLNIAKSLSLIQKQLNQISCNLDLTAENRNSVDTAKEVMNAADKWLQQDKTANETNQLIRESMIMSEMDATDSENHIPLKLQSAALIALIQCQLEKVSKNLDLEKEN